MDNLLLYKMLSCISEKHTPFFLQVEGNSMWPVIASGQTVHFQRRESYKVGDIALFLYKKTELIVHRILKIEDDIYYCKGDNSLRIEDVNSHSIFGIAMLEEDVHNNPRFISDSWEIGQLFRKMKYNRTAVYLTAQYRDYELKYL